MQWTDIITINAGGKRAARRATNRILNKLRRERHERAGTEPYRRNPPHGKIITIQQLK